MTHIPMKSHAFGSIFAMSPGVRTMPAAMALPTATAMPNHTPSTCSSFPRPAEAPAAALVEDPSDVLDNVESQESVRNSAIIMAARQKASLNWPRCRKKASEIRLRENWKELGKESTWQ
jgi:hypothetical protein